MAPWAKESPLHVCFVFLNSKNLLLEHSHFYLFRCMCGCFHTTAAELNYFNRERGAENIYLPFTEKVC